MPIDPVSAGLTGASILASLFGNSGAASAQKANMNAQTALLNRQRDLFDLISGSVANAKKSGYYDPSWRLEQLDRDTSTYQTRDRNNLANSLQIAGYKPGDSTVERQISANDINYRRQREDQADNIRSNVFEQYLNDLNKANPSSLNSGISVYGQRAANAQAQQQPLGGLLQSILPFLNGGGGAKSNTASGFALTPGMPLGNDGYYSAGNTFGTGGGGGSGFYDAGNTFGQGGYKPTYGGF